MTTRCSKGIFALFLAGLMAFSAGCASNSGSSYTSDQARSTQNVQTGTIAHVGRATIEENSSLIGPIVGGIVGGVLGSTLGAGTGRTLAILGGAAGGAVAGSAVDKRVQTQNALELTIQLDSGQTISIVQAEDDYYAVGDKVRILSGADGKSRVQHY